MPSTSSSIDNEQYTTDNKTQFELKKKCNFCNYQSDYLKEHLRKHIFFCDIPYCGFVASTLTEIKNHYFKHLSYM